MERAEYYMYLARTNVTVAHMTRANLDELWEAEEDFRIARILFYEAEEKYNNYLRRVMRRRRLTSFKGLTA